MLCTSSQLLVTAARAKRLAQQKRSKGHRAQCDSPAGQRSCRSVRPVDPTGHNATESVPWSELSLQELHHPSTRSSCCCAWSLLKPALSGMRDLAAGTAIRMSEACAVYHYRRWAADIGCNPGKAFGLMAHEVRALHCCRGTIRLQMMSLSSGPCTAFRNPLMAFVLHMLLGRTERERAGERCHTSFLVTACTRHCHLRQGLGSSV